MAESIEAFVGRLQTEGVEAGRQAAARIEEQAREEAARLLKDAERQASEIREQAEAHAALVRRRMEGELQLAVRDTVLGLRETLTGMLTEVLSTRVEDSLRDGEFLRELIRDALRQYAAADREGRGDIRINFPAEAGAQLTQWAAHELRGFLANAETRFEVTATLEKAGFEYSASSGTVEMTTESVTEILSALVRPELRRILSELSGKHAERENGRAVQAQAGAV